MKTTIRSDGVEAQTGVWRDKQVSLKEAVCASDVVQSPHCILEPWKEPWAFLSGCAFAGYYDKPAKRMPNLKFPTDNAT